MNRTARQFAIADLVQGFRQADLALFLAWDDIRERYVRTFLGPMWIVLSTGIWFSVMGFVMGTLFKQPVSEYLPYLACGLVTWLLISASILEGSNVLIYAKNVITSYNIPIFIHYLRFCFRNSIIFLHNLVILLIVLIVYPPPLSLVNALAVPGLLLDIVIFTSGAMILSLANIRYRDTHMVITNALQILPYVTPIFWHREMLGEHAWVADLNPFYHMIEVVRTPVLGDAPALLSWLVVGGMATLFPLVAVSMYLRFRHRIIFWL